jgi:hypothetical protein
VAAARPSPPSSACAQRIAHGAKRLENVGVVGFAADGGDAPAKARSWIDDLTSGRIQSFTQLAQQERKVERHIRLLITLAFTPPQTLAAIVAGSGSTDLTVTALSQAIPYAWQSQVRQTKLIAGPQAEVGLGLVCR